RRQRLLPRRPTEQLGLSWCRRRAGSMSVPDRAPSHAERLSTGARATQLAALQRADELHDVVLIVRAEPAERLGGGRGLTVRTTVVRSDRGRDVDCPAVVEQDVAEPDAP